MLHIGDWANKGSSIGQKPKIEWDKAHLTHGQHWSQVASSWQFYTCAKIVDCYQNP